MARKLNPGEDRLLTQALLATEMPLPLEKEPFFQDIAKKRDRELRLSPELREFLEREFSLPRFLGF